ncbi:hypothetical protein MHK_003026 [Candidatus Magnetomorum sp. HK-1]|nr:hypothetical protein MHK_003026 [Candidatus Magnetomorum sp. HK-1]
MLKKELDQLYRNYNKKKYIHPDPLEYVHNYKTKKDREVAGLLAACFAYGRVNQILKTLSIIFDVMKSKPYNYIIKRDNDLIKKDFKDFKYRFANGYHLFKLLVNIKNVYKEYGSLESCFIKGYSKEDETILPALNFFSSKLSDETGHLIANPQKGSACKRSNLYLRWMVRNDEVDLGCWKSLSSEKLIIPLDTHMHKIGIILGFTTRKQANMKTAMEITKGFKKILPEDPVKYDFSLTRFGIRDELAIEHLKSFGMSFQVDRLKKLDNNI